jgi:CubicO group peptidase (beta-lactamase class C family)
MNDAVIAFADFLESRGQDPHAFVIMQNGEVKARAAWHPYSLSSPHEMYSLSKSFTSIAAGFAIQAGELRLDDTVVSFFPDDLPEHVSDNLARMTVRDLLTMTAGHDNDDMGELWGDPEGNWPRAFLRRPVPHVPSTHFLYNTSATYMVSAILRVATGETFIDYLKPRLFEPLGIRYWWSQADPKGTPVGGTGLRLSIESIAKFGQVLLQNDGTLLPADFVKLATSAQVPNGDDPGNEWNQGYGFQFWKCTHGAYRGDGAFGQYCLVMPEQNAVLALFSSCDDMGATLNAVWDILLPALNQGSSAPAITLSRDKTQSGTPAKSTWAGTYDFPDRAAGVEAVSIQLKADSVLLTLVSDGKEYLIEAGYSRGYEGITEFEQWNGPEPIWAQANTNGNELVITVRFTEMTQRQTFQFTLGDQLILNRTIKGRFAPDSMPSSVGHRRM